MKSRIRRLGSRWRSMIQNIAGLDAAMRTIESKNTHLEWNRFGLVEVPHTEVDYKWNKWGMIEKAYK